MSEMRVSKAGFEIETCGRCGGSGKFSYNQMHGSRCYGCNGKGIRYTKRGAAAASFLEESMKAPAGSLQIGETIRDHGLTMGGDSYSYWGKIIAIGPSAVRSKGKNPETGEWIEYPPGLEIVTEHPKFGRSSLHCGAEMLIRKAHTAEEKAPKIAAALEYQAALTLAGKPRKRG